MKHIVLMGAVLLSASTCLAQTDAQQQETTPPATLPQGAETSASTGPANLCQEVLAFVQEASVQEESVQPAAAEPEKPVASSSRTEAEASAPDEPAENTADSGTGSAQDITGQDGVATDAPDKDNPEAAGVGSAEDAPQKESRAAPVPPADETSVPVTSVLTLQEAEQLAAANDMAQCQETARGMRLAGVDMPPPLIALAALDLRFHEQAGTAQPGPENMSDEATTDE